MCLTNSYSGQFTAGFHLRNSLALDFTQMKPCCKLPLSKGVRQVELLESVVSVLVYQFCSLSIFRKRVQLLESISLKLGY